MERLTAKDHGRSNTRLCTEEVLAYYILNRIQTAIDQARSQNRADKMATYHAKEWRKLGGKVGFRHGGSNGAPWKM